MKKLALLIGLLVIGVSTLIAQQTRVITGTVTSAVAGEGALPGVTVQVRGTTLGTATDVNGRYTLSVPGDAAALVFTYIGMKRLEVEIAGRSVVDVQLESETVGLQEIVVTSGYGIRRAPKGTSALTQVVSGEKLNEVRQINVNNALAGKIAGIQLRGQSAAALNRTGEIRLRGTGGFETGTSVLYVVDGTILPNPADLNMDEIEDISVLSGASAAAILGAAAADGAVIITTKKAKVTGGRKTGIDVNTGLLASNVYIMPNYQNDYAGGASYDLIKYNWQPNHPVEWQALDGKYYHDYSDDASWGPRMIGQEYIPWYAWYGGHPDAFKTAKLVPQPDNARDFFETGMTWNNSIAFSQVSEGFNVRATLGNVAVKGLLPQTSLNRTNFSVRTTYDITKKLQFGANVNFFTSMTEGEFDDGYSNQSTGSFNQWFHRNLDMDKIRELKDLRTPDGIWASWNHNNPTVYDPANPKLFYAGNYWYNFYKWFDLVKISSRADRLFGDVSLNYNIMEGLSFKFTYRRQQNNIWGETKYSTDLNDSGTQTTGNTPEAKGYYATSTSYSNRENYESNLAFTRTFGDFKVNANIITDFFRAISKSNGANTNNGFNIKNLYTIANSKDQASISNSRSASAYNAMVFKGDVSFRDFLFADLTLRNDWFSQLPADDNAVLSKSFGGSFVFSDLLNLEFMNFGKIRASWGEIPRTIGVFAYPGFAYGVNQFQWSGNFLMSTPDQVVDPNIKGAVNTMREVGLELRFLNSRFGFNGTYWDGTELNIPYAVQIANYSGFSSKYLNTGEITKKGIDLGFNFRPLQGTNLSWDMNVTVAWLLEQKIVRIAEGINQFQVQSQWSSRTPNLWHVEGKEWGQIYGYGMKVDSLGRPLLTTNGDYVTDPAKYFGSSLPDVTGGIQNSFRILKNFTVIANFDYQFGGKFFSLSDMWGTFSGLTARTSGLNDRGKPIRDPVEDGGGIHVAGVDATTGAPVDYYVDAQTYYHNLYYNNIFDSFVYDLSYFKLREFSIGYNVPVKSLGNLGRYIQNATVSVVAQNAWLIWNKTNNDFDPSEISRAGGETGQFPGVRSIGTNIRITF